MRIRVGLGGVMLRHYQPVKIAEMFCVQASLVAGLVDLDIGKAIGGLLLLTRALQCLRDSSRMPERAKRNCAQSRGNAGVRGTSRRERLSTRRTSSSGGCLHTGCLPRTRRIARPFSYLGIRD